LSKYEWPLMANAIGEEEKSAMLNFIESSNRFTNGPKVKEFERKWSQWLGIKHSVFVNSGSSANALLLWAVKRRFFDPEDKEMVVLTPACTWATNLATLQQFNIRFVVCDNDLWDFGFSEDTLKEVKMNYPDVNVIWATHLMGSPVNMDLIDEYFPDAHIIEDCCESHGADLNGKLVGTFGVGSTFSFYFGHHMTTIEGGMICTNDTDFYHLLLMLRSHGLSRELPVEVKQKFERKNPEIDSRFLFPEGGFNFRSGELNAVIGLTQLSHLDRFIQIRKENVIQFDSILRKHPQLFKPFNLKGNSSMVLPFICQTSQIRNTVLEKLEEQGIETRPFLVGNILNQPFVNAPEVVATPNADFLDKCAFYIGNNQFVGKKELRLLEKALSEVSL
jgi:CDP-6-deoxy-D-xylo-4-hexulose-3-dehydrase